MDTKFNAELDQEDLRRVGDAEAGVLDFASTTQQLVVPLSSATGRRHRTTPPGAAWMRLDDRQRALVKRENLRAASIALADAPRAAAAGFGNHGSRLVSIYDNDNARVTPIAPSASEDSLFDVVTTKVRSVAGHTR